jgi:clan AA aspartic protease (TIGR02281 family)
MRFLILLFFCLLTISKTIAQDIVKMEKSGGVYFIPCKVNGLALKFIFDTGASDVSISLTEALFMLKNGYLNETDIKGTVYYSIANGEIAEGTKINIQKIEVGKQILYNVEASIVHSTEAPLLFGQSAMERFGKFTMDYSNSNLIIGGSSSSASGETNTSAFKSVKIGSQTWMTENLNLDRFRNGDLIPEAKTIKDFQKAGNEGKPAWCYYNNDPKNGLKYGKLYNWYAVNDPRGMAPAGWHIPTDEEWCNLKEYLGGGEVAGMKIKSKNGWAENGNGTNEYGFLGLPSGYRPYDDLSTNIGKYCFWWSSSENGSNSTAWGHQIYCGNSSMDRSDYLRENGLSVRCIKD